MPVGLARVRHSVLAQRTVTRALVIYARCINRAPVAYKARTMTRIIIIVALAFAAGVASADPLLVPFTGGNCQFGYYWTGSYCVPSGAPGAAAKPPGGSCPNGWLASGNACVRRAMNVMGPQATTPRDWRFRRY
jgi:hypothetical protein